MSQIIEQVKNVTKQLGKGITELFKKGETKTVILEELASIIISNHKGNKRSLTLLGLVFNTYKIKVGPINFKLETKGENDEFILEFSAHENGIPIFFYKSYEKSHSLKDKQMLPEYVSVYLKEASS